MISMDIRHDQRIKIIQELYRNTFFAKDSPPSLAVAKTRDIIENATQINDYIKKYAQKFPIEKIAKVDLAILQLAVYELVFEKKEPPKVIINEAIELAKEMGSGRSFAFINAVLGKIYQQHYAGQPKKT
ncbi:transcription antitermination factor NusB [Candidatus Roizmanbacteria bacterium CG09_land_8_20_14_0_10_41_9]|uniref:Transcription antitermination factor NusB n=1 Tax=Candidatus Roizmanbacteria bacterium CG09_land_8_20_14_0_10_41_9 TaxID=1974850 RepID=A0A2H0WSL3_9BACT|nr:MAG: transcription antitermination factor NusB [Candidatus Roizmanbacteria bacterium CG09_land_8_20_14_0_10_41_9]